MQNLTNIIRSSYSTSGFMLFASPVAALPEPIEALPRCPSGRWCTRWCHGGTMLWHFAVYYSSLRVGVSVGAGPRSVPGRGLPPPGRSDHPSEPRPPGQGRSGSSPFHSAEGRGRIASPARGEARDRSFAAWMACPGRLVAVIRVGFIPMPTQYMAEAEWALGMRCTCDTHYASIRAS